MCGIAAIFSDTGLPRDVAEDPQWERCLNAIDRRGPDGRASWLASSRHALLGHTRLAIVDPTERGSQPMVARDHSVAITYNGEIYNAPALRTELVSCGHAFRSTCDTEVLLRGWLEWGEGVLDRLHGMYAFVIWDDSSRELTAAVDHAGMKPLYWKYESGQLYIASDADAVRALTRSDEAIDAITLRNVLILSCCPGPRTMWEGINKLEPGRVMQWQPVSAPRVRRYWSPPESIDQSRLMNDTEFGSLFEQVVREHMFADVPVGAFLSGGLDSAAIVAAAVASGVRPECYTLSMESNDESADAARVASRLELSHHIARAGTGIDEDLDDFALAYDEPQGYSALLNATRISKLARKDLKAVIAGDGGDEAFGGYLWQRETGPNAWQHLPERSILKRQRESICRAVRSPEADDETRKAARNVFGSTSFVHAYASRVFPGFHPAEAHALTESMGGSYDEDQSVDWLTVEDCPVLPHLRRVQRLDLVGFCAASILPKIDRAAMQVGLEVRSPLLDRRLLDLGMSAPILEGEEDRTGDQSRPYLRNYVRNRLGTEFTKRPKQGFSLRVRTEHAQWEQMASSIDAGLLVKTGALRADWRRYVPRGDTPRLRLLVMIDAWSRARLG
ncbi:MAG: asparagine synthase (glutamine-hydrolyzing) [Phycisphaerales bacterium]